MSPNICDRGEKLMKQKYFLILAVIALMIGLFAGCQNKTDKTDETMDDIPAESNELYEENNESAGDAIEDLPENLPNDYLIEDTQCIWGTWIITEVWAGEVFVEDSDRIGTIVKILPESFSYGDDTSEEIIGYTTEALAVIGQDEHFREIGAYGELGMTGDYFLIFHPSWDDYKLSIFPHTAFILLSETEMMIPCARSGRILLEKVQDAQLVEVDVSLLIGSPHSVCYGEWIITDAIKTDENLEEELYIGKILQISEKQESVISCRALGRSIEAVDELADLVGVSESNQYLIIYNLSETYFWEQMICIDDMTAVLVKGNNLFRVKRISDPIEDGIYNEIG